MQKNKDLLELTEDILTDLELSRIPFEQICLKVSRLGRLLGDTNIIKWIKFELTGYPVDKEGQFTKESHFISNKYSGRSYYDSVNKGHYLFTETIPQIEAKISSAKIELSVAIDPNISITSANPSQYVMTPVLNGGRRKMLNDEIVKYTEKLSKIKHSIHKFVIEKNYELSYGDTVYDIFESLRSTTISRIGILYPQGLEILSSIHDNLKSENKTDWSNAVHNCRRVLYELSNVLYPASSEEIDIGNGNRIKLNDQNYIARIKQYIKGKSLSKNFNNVIGDSLEYIGDRLDSIYKSTTIGSHIIIEDKTDAERYVIYTFILLGDILSL